jgi:hypothetical protein
MQLAGKIKYRSMMSDGFDARIAVKVGGQIPLHQMATAVSFSLSSLSELCHQQPEWLESPLVVEEHLPETMVVLQQVAVFLGAEAKQSSW